MKSNKQIAREGVNAEHSAIRQYNRMLKQTKDPHTKKVIRHINSEERMHVREFSALARHKDKEVKNTAKRSKTRYGTYGTKEYYKNIGKKGGKSRKRKR